MGFIQSVLAGAAVHLHLPLAALAYSVPVTVTHCFAHSLLCEWGGLVDIICCGLNVPLDSP